MDSVWFESTIHHKRDGLQAEDNTKQKIQQTLFRHNERVHIYPCVILNHFLFYLQVWDDELLLVALTYAKQCPGKHYELMERAMFST